MKTPKKSFVTGSYAYGTPTEKSDIDLVVFVSRADIARLVLLADRDYGTANKSYREEDARSIRFGKLNLLCVTDEKHFRVWREGTKALKRKSPVTRAAAIEFLAELRKEHGLAF